MNSYPELTSPTGWEIIGWNDFAATYNHLILPTTPRRSMRVRRFTESLENFLLESYGGEGPFQNYWYTSGMEFALDHATDSHRNPYAPLPKGQEFQQIMQLQPHAPMPCEQCGKAFETGICVELLVLYTECFCSVECAVKYQNHRRRHDRFLRQLDGREDVPLPEDSSLWPAFFLAVPTLSQASPAKKEVKRPQVLKKNRATAPDGMLIPMPIPVLNAKESHHAPEEKTG